MKKQYRAGLVILFALSIILSADLLHAKPAPPPRLAAIFDNLTELENEFKAGEWNKALKSTNKISSTFNEILPQLQKNINADITKTFLPMMANIKQSILKKDKKSIEEQYIAIEKLFLIIMENYEYTVSPIMLLVDRNISEAERAIKKNDFKRVVSEMDEVSEYFFRVESLLKEKGAKHEDIDEFKTTVREVREAGKAKNARVSRNGLKKLDKLSGTFLQLF
jgi:hypothetical protein